MGTCARLLGVLGCAGASSFANAAGADSIFLETIAAGDLQTQQEFVSYTADGVGFAGIRFSVGEPVLVTGSLANLFKAPHGSSDLFFMGIEALSQPTDVPSFVLDAGPAALLAYAEAQASPILGSEVFFPLEASLGPGSYALLVGCVELDCYGALPTGAAGSTPLIPEDDFLLSYGTTSSQNWGYTSPTFRLALYAVPEPATGLLVALGLLGSSLSVRRRSRSAGRAARRPSPAADPRI